MVDPYLAGVEESAPNIEHPAMTNSAQHIKFSSSPITSNIVATVVTETEKDIKKYYFFFRNCKKHEI